MMLLLAAMSCNAMPTSIVLPSHFVATSNFEGDDNGVNLEEVLDSSALLSDFTRI